jgi:1-acyl-sn-glycerol-3-phosphate acyltransferase
MVCSGAHRIMEKRSLKIHPGEIVVEFLDPIESAGYSIDQRDELNEKIRAAMAASLPPDQRPLDSPGAIEEPAEA